MTAQPTERGAPALPRAHGGALGGARLRCAPEDFRVVEQLAFAFEGQGEHVYLKIRKREANTEWVAQRLAALAGAPRAAVGFAGKKDRHAVAEQWFSVHVPGRDEPDWSALDNEEVQVLDSARHARKLRTGALRGNAFDIVLRELDAPRAALDARLSRIAAEGVPNYFGEQRFGIDGGNLERAAAMFAGRLRERNRSKRGLYLSAARSWLFNLVLARRVEDGTWNRALDGDVMMLDGSQAVFDAGPGDAAIDGRVQSMDIHPTGPMWGRGELRTRGEARRIEEEVLESHAAWREGLERAGMKQERRALRLPVRDLGWTLAEPRSLRLRFFLGAGSYATGVLHEIVEYVDVGGDTR